MKAFWATLITLAVIALLALSPAVNAQGTPQATVDAFLNAFNSGNVDQALAAFSDDATVVTPSDVYPGKGLVKSWIQARVAVDKIKWDRVGTPTVSGNKVTFEVKPTTGANQQVTATVDNNKITRMEIKAAPAPAPAAAAQGTPGAAGTPAAGAAAGAAQTTSGTPAAGAAGAVATPRPAATTTTPSALPTTGQSDPFFTMLWVIIVGLFAIGLGLALNRQASRS